MRLTPTLLIVAFCAAAPATSLAQTAPGAEPGVTRDDCLAAPDAGNGQATQQPDSDLTAKLDKCNGVLQPPPTGDAEIREPAPDTGETPVIPPSAVPEQPPTEQSPTPPPASGDTPT